MPAEHLFSPLKRITVQRTGAAIMAGIGRSKIDELIATGQIEAVKSGKSLLILVDSLERYIASLPRAELKSTYPKPRAAQAKMAAGSAD
jgi:excisionase family DNA binding protein